jgi:DNA-binding MarR family transcriptional regulator
MRRSSDRLYTMAGLTPREREARRLVEERPGITVAELREALGVGRARIWQIVNALERGCVWRAGDPPTRLLRPHALGRSGED